MWVWVRLDVGVDMCRYQRFDDELKRAHKAVIDSGKSSKKRRKGRYGGEAKKLAKELAAMTVAAKKARDAARSQQGADYDDSEAFDEFLAQAETQSSGMGSGLSSIPDDLGYVVRVTSHPARRTLMWI